MFEHDEELQERLRNGTFVAFKVQSVQLMRQFVTLPIYPSRGANDEYCAVLRQRKYDRTRTQRQMSRNAMLSSKNSESKIVIHISSIWSGIMTEAVEVETKEIEASETETGDGTLNQSGIEEIKEEEEEEKIEMEQSILQDDAPPVFNMHGVWEFTTTKSTLSPSIGIIMLIDSDPYSDMDSFLEDLDIPWAKRKALKALEKVVRYCMSIIFVVFYLLGLCNLQLILLSIADSVTYTVVQNGNHISQSIEVSISE